MVENNTYKYRMLYTSLERERGAKPPSLRVRVMELVCSAHHSEGRRIFAITQCKCVSLQLAVCKLSTQLI